MIERTVRWKQCNRLPSAHSTFNTSCRLSNWAMQCCGSLELSTCKFLRQELPRTHERSLMISLERGYITLDHRQ